MKRVQFNAKTLRIFTDEIEKNETSQIRKLFADSDTYIRKVAYTALSKLYFQEIVFQKPILSLLQELFEDSNEYIRQTAIYTIGEIGQRDFDTIEEIFTQALDDHNKFVKAAIKGSLKRAGEKNPGPTFAFIKNHIHHPDPEIRKEMIHGSELRGRLHPEEVLPLLKPMQDDPDSSVRAMVVHVLSQISYKQGCLEKVLFDLRSWSNLVLVEKALKKIKEIHRNYENFAIYSPQQVEQKIHQVFHN